MMIRVGEYEYTDLLSEGDFYQLEKRSPHHRIDEQKGNQQ